MNAGNPVSTDPPNQYPVVGIGASAGGLEALERLFQAMPADTGMAFVIVQHLSPDFKSLMPELLERRTAMPVVAVEGEQPLRPNTVFVVTSGITLEVRGDALHVEPRSHQFGHALPINLLFESMAELGPRAVAIVLSGTGSDGTQGAMRVHQSGGLVLAQSPTTARFDSMPRNAVEAGCVDIVADPADMPRAIEAWIADPVKGRSFNQAGETPQAEHGGPYGRILAQLHAAYGIDFEHYKQSTIFRRIERRLASGVNPVSPEAYAERLMISPGELDQLFSDLLIGVTRFFRDEAAYRCLRTLAIEPLVDALGPKDELRIWVCGCSTGEEPYSIAMLALEAFEQRGRPPRLRVLATDLHGTSLQTASSGVYSIESLAAVPQAWREKYFVAQPTGLYKVSDELRRLVIFSAHNVLRDAAFTRIDLVSCRNVLIYFQQAAQKRALAAFHFALRPAGLLLLGESEGTGELHEAFEFVDREARLFRKAPGVALPAELRASLTSLVPQRPTTTTLDGRATHRLFELLLQSYLPAGLLVSSQHEVMHVFGDAGRWLQPTAGRFRGELSTMLAGPLRSAVFLAVRKATQTRESVSFGDIADPTRPPEGRMRVVVDPVVDRTLPQVYYMVRFVTEEPSAPKVAPLAMQAPTDENMALHVEELETELNRVREALQHTVEELEAANEELQAGNEELMAANEELQSTNEELHAVNEELYSVNAEHELKIQELRATTADMNNLIRATELAILFLDMEVRLRLFTPAASEIFPLRPGDIGRDLRDFMPREADDALAADIAAALAEPQVLERELTLSDGRHLRRRLTPYRDSGNQPAGLVLTYDDVTSQSRLREQLAQEAAQTQVRAIVESVPQLMWSASADGQVDYLNPQWLAYTGIAAERQLGFGWLDQVYPPDHEDLLAAWQHALDSGQAMRQRFRLRRHDGQFRWFDAQVVVQHDSADRVRRWYGSATDDHDRALLEQALAEREAFVRLVADNHAGMVSYWDVQRRNRFTSARCREWLGKAPEQLIGHGADDVFGATEWAERRRFFDAALAGEWQRQEREFTRPDGSIGHALSDYVPHRVGDEVRGVIVTDTDVSAIAEAKAAIDEIFDASPAAILVVSAEGRIVRGSAAAGEMLGYSAENLVGMSVEQLVPPALRMRHQMLRSAFMAKPYRRAMGNSMAFPLIRGDGTVAEVDIQLAPIVHDGRRVVVVGLRDLREVRRALGDTDAAVQARGVFLANVSHEIRTPLNAILGMAQLLELDSPTESQLDRLRRIEEAGTHLLAIVNDILDLAKIEAGRIELAAEDFDVARLAERSIAMVAERARIKHLALRTNIDPSVPAWLRGDARRIEQILVNYLANAVKFTPAGSVTVRMSATASSGSWQTLTTEVVDTGIGIAPEQQPALFSPFHQADGGSGRRYGGIGLGLAISRQLARAMKGDCGVRSALGAGSTFWFTVQVERATGATEPKLTAPPSAYETLGAGRRVLVVEDDAISRIVIAELIHKISHATVDIAEDGSSAVAMAAATPYDMILMDMQLPGIDGLEATRQIRAAPRGAAVPIVALTANVMADDVERCLAAGMNAHLGKPVVAAELRNAMARWLSHAAPQ